MSDTKKVIGQSVRSQQRSLSDRIGTMEQSVAKMLFGINQRFMGSDQQINELIEKVDALVQLQGAEDVSAYIANARIERARAASAQEQASLEEAIKDEIVKPAEAAEERSLIVGRYYHKDGSVQEPGRAQLVMPGVQAEARAKLLGQKAGFVLDLPDGSKFELLEIYSVDEERAVKLREERQKAALDAATAAAQAVAKEDESQDAVPPTEAPAEEAVQPEAQ